MRHQLAAGCAIAFFAIINNAQAAGCVSGAIVGGAAGHMVGHGKAGAVAGCLYGHHENKKQQQQGADPQKSNQNQPH
jgi:uncharacterized protein YcfJ